MMMELSLGASLQARSTVLVLSPHTDDGELGCGGTLAKLVALGHRVVSVAFSAAEDSVPAGLPRDILRHENKAACQCLGIAAEDSIVLDFKVRTFPEHRQQILDTMLLLNRKYQPSLVLLPSTTDTHQDHITIAEEGFRAFKRTTMLAYEKPWNNIEFSARCFVILDEADLQRKIAALACYESQKGRQYINADYVRALALVRGTQIGQPMAELFDTPRLILR